MISFIKITQKKSAIGCIKKHRATLTGLGLHHIGDSVIREKNISILGMINKISYMLTVEEVT
ncbi:50S ribosomal protein L30 [Buchnera aphidicola (Thelaxes californica)]|uniref:Large ribosomal subunit protein uL30 n=1 Tax=Buchnera aphidicola (Thelaxes californica) TaxID=1315998 RepID=A0A4D6YLK8_9GAMM|nr:50S ribosomal protein L30 [Buchnera aphidicola]QCI26910.1 50S ribosomal protein L30 [Buchnera aphidicola (Thelaxes californica)]